MGKKISNINCIYYEDYGNCKKSGGICIEADFLNKTCKYKKSYKKPPPPPPPPELVLVLPLKDELILKHCHACIELNKFCLECLSIEGDNTKERMVNKSNLEGY